jgi:hypothetical protein
MSLSCKGCRKKDHDPEDCDYFGKGNDCTCQHKKGCRIIVQNGVKLVAPPGVTAVDVMR